MKVIRSTGGTKVLLDDDDYLWVRFYSLYDNGRFISFCDRGKNKPLCREILHITDPKVHIDHENMNYRDNRKGNLRPGNGNDNAHNRAVYIGSVSRYKGVSWKTPRKKWQAAIKVNGQTIYLGLFENEVDAAKAYNRAAKELHGKFARLNEFDEATTSKSETESLKTSTSKI